MFTSVALSQNKTNDKEWQFSLKVSLGPTRAAGHMDGGAHILLVASGAVASAGAQWLSGGLSVQVARSCHRQGCCHRRAGNEKTLPLRQTKQCSASLLRISLRLENVTIKNTRHFLVVVFNIFENSQHQ